MTFQRVRVKNCITIINTYAPHTQRVREDPTELDQFYTDLADTMNEIKDDKTTSTSLLLIAGDFNAKVGKKKNEPCLGKHSRGERNNSGQTLVDFCILHDLFIANSSFKHPARHITTWESMYTSIDTVTNTSKLVKVFNQIDYVMCRTKHKHILQNARSYAGTETSSDHRLVVTKMKVERFNLYKRNKTKNHAPIDTDKLKDPEKCNAYTNKLKEEFDVITEKEYSNDQQKWDDAVKTIVNCGEEILGTQRKVNKNHGRNYDKEIEELSVKQKELRLRISSSKSPKKIKKMKHQRNVILKQIHKKVLQNREAELDEIVKSIESLQDENKMFKATKLMNRKSFENPFVHDEKGKHVSNPTEIYKIVHDHFEKHFYDKDEQQIQPFTGEPKCLDNPITTEEVSQAIAKLNNNRAAGPDRISAELMKYAPTEVHIFISNLLNHVLESHQDLDVGSGLLCSLCKPGKPKGPVKNLRPVILLTMLRKILSIILLKRIKPAYEDYISPSQSAYRTNRSTSDVVWAHRWITAKTQKEETQVFITGIDMSSAFDTIIRQRLIEILETIIPEDEVRMSRLLLSNTTLKINMKGVNEIEKFTSNKGSPQGDSISGIFFNIYLEDSLRQARHRVIANDPSIEHSYMKVNHTNLPKEIIYADDTDLLAKEEKEKLDTLDAVNVTFPSCNLKVNDDKTEHTIIKRCADRNDETWRHVKKVGSLLGDSEDMIRRKQLAMASMNRLQSVWLRKDHISEAKRLRLYNCLIFPILLYNCSTWGISKKDEESLDAFHRSQLRYLLGKKFPSVISNENLYIRCGAYPVSLFILKARWKLFGHILRLDRKCPANAAMDFYFELTNDKKFRGRPRTTLVTTLQSDIKKTLEKIPSFPIKCLKNADDLECVRTIATNRLLWRDVISKVYRIAEDEKLLSGTFKSKQL